MAKKLAPQTIYKILKEWDDLNGSYTLTQKRRMVARAAQCSPATVKRYVKLREAGRITHNGDEIRGPRFFPEDEKLPVYVIRGRGVNPCHECRALLMEDGGQAVIIEQTYQNIAYVVCRDCGHRFKLTYRGLKA